MILIYSLRPKILVGGMDVSRCILVLDTSIFIHFYDKYYWTEGVIIITRYKEEQDPEMLIPRRRTRLLDDHSLLELITLNSLSQLGGIPCQYIMWVSGQQERYRSGTNRKYWHASC